MALTKDRNAVSSTNDGSVRNYGLGNSVLVPNEDDVLAVTLQGNNNVLVSVGSVVGQHAINVDLEEVLGLVGRIDVHVMKVQTAVNSHFDRDRDVRNSRSSLDARRDAFGVQSPRSSALTRAASIMGTSNAS